MTSGANEPQESMAPFPRKAGRPSGSKNLRSRESSRVLAALGFDPIAVMVKSYDITCREIEREQRKEKPSGVTLAALLTVQNNQIKELMRYGYARVTETTVVETKAPPVMMVITTPQGWKPGDAVPGLRAESMDDFGDDMSDDTEQDGGLNYYDAPVREKIPELPPAPEFTVDDS
jgi:hypothetical protein